MNIKCCLFLLLLPVLLGATPALAQPGEEPEQVFAIQNRIFDRDHEIRLDLGFIPNDDFYYGYPVGLSYTFNYNENLAWEVIRGQWFFNVEKSIKTDIENDFGVTPSHFDEMDYSLHTSLVLKPSYGKDALWNRKVINHETFAAAGVGLVSYTRHYSFGADGSELAPSIAFGLGRKYFINDKYAINLEFRDFINFKSAGAENIVYLGVGICYRFNMTPRRGPEENSVDSFRRYLKSHE